MTDTDVQQNVENNDSVESTDVSEDTFDFKGAYHKEIANAKKQRQSRQKMETELEGFKQKEADRKRKRLESEGEFKTIIADLEAENANYKAIVDEVKSNQQKEKEKILETFAEEERDELSSLDLASLKLVQKKINTAQGVNPKAVPNVARTTQEDSDLADWKSWDQAKRKANWDKIREYESSRLNSN